MYFKREITEEFKKLNPHYPIIAVVGPRQAGKTTFLKEQTGVERLTYLTLDDPEVLGLFDEDIKKFELQYIQDNQILILDEVHGGKDAGVKLKYLADKGHRLWISSSSQTLLGKEVLSYLVGRVSILNLYQFSFEEFLLAKNTKAMTNDATRRNIWEHLTFGGYPKVVITQEIDIKKTILRDLYQTLTLKDISRTFGIENLDSLERLITYMSHEIGNVTNYQKVSSDLKISFQTVSKYLDAMEKSYLIKKVHPFFTNKIKEIIKQPKIYFIDTGLRNVVANEFEIKFGGKIFENYVLCELLKAGYEVKHWQTKNKAEVDFVIEREGKVIPIEVKLNQNKPTIERSLRAFLETYELEKGYVVYYEGKEAELIVGKTKIVFTGVQNLIKELKLEKSFER